MDQGDLVLLGQGQRRLDCAVAAADDDDLLAHIFLGRVEAVHHGGKVFAGDAQMARIAPLSTSQNDAFGGVDPFGGGEAKGGIGTALDRFHRLAGAHIEAFGGDLRLPPGQ